MRSSIVYLVSIMAGVVLLATWADAEGYYADQSPSIELWGSIFDNNSGGASYATTSCFGIGGHTRNEWTGGGIDCAASDAGFTTPMPVYIDKMCYQHRTAFNSTTKGCDVRLSADGGATQLGSNDLSFPLVDGAADAIGDTYCVSIDAVVPFGSRVNLQSKSGTNSPAGGTGACDANILDQWISVTGYWRN